MYITKKQILTITGICFVILSILGIKQHLNRKKPVQIVYKILKIWQTENVDKAIDFWEQREKTPPIYNLSSYSILQKQYFTKNGYHYAQILVNLTLHKQNPPAKKGKWIFILRKGHLGWKVMDFVHYNP